MGYQLYQNRELDELELLEEPELLEELAGTGTWLEGQRFRSGVSQADVTDWVNGLDI